MIAGVIRALIFDFDGLILDTEGPIYQSWQEVYQSHGQHLPVDVWVQTLGTWDALFDPHADLESRLGRKLDWAKIEPHRQQREAALILHQPVLPGVRDYIQKAHRLQLKLGVASSSNRDWVQGHLQRLRLFNSIDCLRVREDVQHTKPDPELYLSVTACLNVRPCEAIALEDSHHGVVAARAAGLYAIAVPNDLTAQLPFTEAHLRLESLASLPLEKLIAAIESFKD